jgi:hypothetical protein
LRTVQSSTVLWPAKIRPGLRTRWRRKSRLSSSVAKAFPFAQPGGGSPYRTFDGIRRGRAFTSAGRFSPSGPVGIFASSLAEARFSQKNEIVLPLLDPALLTCKHYSCREIGSGAASVYEIEVQLRNKSTFPRLRTALG